MKSEKKENSNACFLFFLVSVFVRLGVEWGGGKSKVQLTFCHRGTKMSSPPTERCTHAVCRIKPGV